MPPQTDLRLTTPLKIVYSLTLGSVATLYLFFYLTHCFGSLGGTGDNIFSVSLRYLPFLFVMSAIPLAIFTLVFFTKGAGLEYFRSRNAGKKMSLSALAITIGYIFVVFSPNTSVNPAYAPNHYDYYYTYFGLIIIVCGFVSLLVYSRQFAGEQDTRKIK